MNNAYRVASPAGFIGPMPDHCTAKIIALTKALKAQAPGSALIKGYQEMIARWEVKRGY